MQVFWQAKGQWRSCRKSLTADRHKMGREVQCGFSRRQRVKREAAGEV